jgi:hypothetical protein
LPLQRDQPGLPGQIVGGLIGDTGMELVVDDDDHRDDHHCNDNERLKK